MTLLLFLGSVVIVSLSGVMAPGPITAATIAQGTRSKHAGLLIAVGHGVVEYPLMLLVFWGLGTVFELPLVRPVISITGGLLLGWMAWGMFRGARVAEVTAGKLDGRPLWTGILLSAANPYFLVWWATVGAALLANAYAFGIKGVLLFAVVHWLCDVVWYWLLTQMSFKGGTFFGNRFQRGVFWVCGVFLAGFCVMFVINGLKQFV